MDDLTIRLMRLSARGYCCSQIMALLALESQGRDNPDLVRSMAGLCLGVGNSGETCGVLTGAACLLALYAGRGSDREEADERLALMFAELTDWFSRSIGETYGGICCRDILGEEGAKPDPGRCAPILLDTYRQVQHILLENGFDPSRGRHEEP